MIGDFVLENYRRLVIRKDHAVVVPRVCCPAKWFRAGDAFIAPLPRKRTIHLDRSKWVNAWTIYNEEIGTNDWLTPAEVNRTLHFPVEIRSRDPSGWLITIPMPIRDRGWLPPGPGTLMFEYTPSEANLWTEAAYNEESILEADLT
ncbi:MAG: hypothetical protein JWO52_2442 [Gammaproteobacteria bacterium]|nr:hypothetical protein [Gammaproteobacteria bacterium]